MKKNPKRILVWIVLILSGWFAGYLKVPYIDSSYEFWIGFSVCILCFIIGYFIYGVRRLNKKITEGFKKPSLGETGINKAPRRYRKIWLNTSILIFLGCIILGGTFYKQSRRVSRELHSVQDKLTELQELTDALSKRNTVDLMSNVLTLVDNELRENSEKHLSESTIARIAAFSQSLKPYKYFIGDSLSTRLLSPERGQLLTALTLMEMDSISFARIKSEVDFRYSDMRHVKLDSVDYSNINLENSDFSYAQIEGINFDGSVLRNANFIGAKLNRASMNKVNLRNANLQWVQMVQGMMKHSDASGANLSYGQFQYSNLSGSKFDIASLQHAKLVNSTLYRSDFARAQLSNCDMTNCYLKDGRLIKSETAALNLSGASLDNVEVTKNWFEENKSILGTNYVMKNYIIFQNQSNKLNTKYYLIKR